MATTPQSETNRRTERPQAPTPASGRSLRSPVRSLFGVQVLATGSYVPDPIVTNADLGALGYDSDWILQRTGIQARRRAPEGMATSDLALQAAEACLAAADVDRQEIDLVLVATMTPDSPMPSTACLLQDQLGLCAAAMDVNAACAGFMYALITGQQYVKSGASSRALVVGADVNTRILNPADKKTFPLFGDGAGAVLLGPGGDHQGLLAYTLGSEGEGASLLGIPGGGSRLPMTPEGLARGDQFIRMDGRPVFKWAVRLLADTVQDVLSHAGLTVDELDLLVLHQANMRIIDAAADALGVERSKLVINLDRYGNTSAGSIPLCLDEAYRAGRIKAGDKILLCGFGAGLAWGTAVIQW